MLARLFGKKEEDLSRFHETSNIQNHEQTMKRLLADDDARDWGTGQHVSVRVHQDFLRTPEAQALATAEGAAMRDAAKGKPADPKYTNLATEAKPGTDAHAIANKYLETHAEESVRLRGGRKTRKHKRKSKKTHRRRRASAR